MYTVYADEELVYSPNMVDLGYVIHSAKITMEMNRAGSFDFIIPPTNPSYSVIAKLKTNISVKQGSKEIWRGRVLNDEKDFYKNKHIYCEGELAFLNDVIVHPYDYSENPITVVDFALKIMTKYQESASDYRAIYLGYANAVPEDTKVNFKIEDYSNCFTEFVDRMVGTFGVGFIYIRRSNDRSYINWVSSEDRVINSEIRFGKNLLDLDEYIDASEVYTRVLPLGKQLDDGTRVQITSVNNNKNYLQSEEGMNVFGRITRVITYDDIDDPAALKNAAQADLDQAIKMATTITISAVDLSLLDAEVDEIKVGYYVPVISEPHGIDTNFLCTKIVMDLLQPELSEYTLGFYANALTDRQVRIAKLSDSSYNTSQKNSGSISSMQSSMSNDYVSTSVYNNYVTKTDNSIEALTARVAALEKG